MNEVCNYAIEGKVIRETNWEKEKKEVAHPRKLRLPLLILSSNVIFIIPFPYWIPFFVIAELK